MSVRSCHFPGMVSVLLEGDNGARWDGGAADSQAGQAPPLTSHCRRFETESLSRNSPFFLDGSWTDGAVRRSLARHRALYGQFPLYVPMWDQWRVKNIAGRSRGVMAVAKLGEGGRNEVSILGIGAQDASIK